jgi:two-component SAPR family response regulator
MTIYKLVWFIDNHEIDLFILEREAEKYKFAEKYSGFSDAARALSILHEIDASQHYNLLPDLIFLDSNMPFINGEMFAHSVANMSEAMKNSIKIVICTSGPLISEEFSFIEKFNFIVGAVNKPVNQATFKKYNREY